MFDFFNWIFRFMPFIIFFIVLFIIFSSMAVSQHKKNSSGYKVKIEEKYNKQKEMLESIANQAKESIEQEDYYCEYCGSRNDKSAKKCDCCGARIRKR